MVTVMAAADHGGPAPDLYQLLGVSRRASSAEITQAWRRRARDEHPDARPDDADAPGRFRALAEAYQVLADPASRRGRAGPVPRPGRGLAGARRPGPAGRL